MNSQAQRFHTILTRCCIPIAVFIIIAIGLIIDFNYFRH